MNTPQDNQPLAGLKAVVTGGSMGIGAAICDHLAALGAQVCSISRSHRKAPSPHPVTEELVDLGDPVQVRALAARLRAAGDVDILVNNAGVVVTRPLEDATEDDFDLLMNLHVRTAMLLAQAVIPGMKQRRSGRIVNLSSRAIVGMAGRTTYAGSKAALIAMTRTWALELAAFGVTVNAVSPGPVVTPMLERDLPEGSAKANALAASIPTRRLGRPDDVARAIAFFAAPANGWITGQNLFVCGGTSLATSLAL